MALLDTFLQEAAPFTYQTRGFGTKADGTVDGRGWQPKTGQKIVGAGVEVTTLQLVGADQEDYHYHAVGMAIEPTGNTAIAPLQSFEISDLTIDCNADNQPGRPTPGYAPVACGAVRILGAQSCIRRVKAINFGTKSFKEGCFVLSIIQASGKPTGADTQPIITETVHSGIEDCIAIQPSKNNAREATVLHIGGLKNSDNHAQGFGRAAFVRKNFVDCQYLTSVSVGQTAVPFSSAFVTSKTGTQIVGSVGTFVGKRALVWNPLDEGGYVRFYNPRDSQSRWNGYFKILTVSPSFQIDLTGSTGTTNDSSFVIMGTEFRAIAVSSCEGAVVEENQIHNCWIGGPYASPLYDPVTPPTYPADLFTEQSLDPLNALNTRSLIVRNNFYKNVAAGPYWNMGGVSGTASISNMSYASGTGLVTVTTARNHKLWLNARVKIESAPNPAYEGSARFRKSRTTRPSNTCWPPACQASPPGPPATAWCPAWIT